MLPFLRRYARALTGSQKRGDEWVRLCAEVLREESPDAEEYDTKQKIFTLFHRLRQPFDVLEERETAADGVPGRLKAQLSEIPVLQRQMLLLTALEGFSIEDEAVIALDVAKIVQNAGHQVVGIAATEKNAVELARKHSPHLVLADIQLKGSDNGIAAVREIMKGLEVPVIFVTGFPERLLTGSGVEPVFVITKPFDPDLLRTAMAQALNTVAI